MRILFATFSSPESFLDHLHIADGDEKTTLTVSTKARHEAGEELVVEIGFPGLPNRVLIRATAVEAADGDEGETQRFELAADELLQRDFLIAVASGRADADWTRRSRRFPVRMPARVVVKGEGESPVTETAGETEDMAKGGLALKTSQALPDGTQVTVVLTPGDGSEEIELTGKVVWNREQGDQAEVGVQFDETGSDPIKRLRQIIRGVRVSGKTIG